MRRVSSPLVCVVRGSAAGHDRGVLPVTPFSLWCLVPGSQSGAGGDHAGWVLSLRARRSDSAFPAPPPGQPHFLPVHDEGEAAMAARKKNTKTDAVSGSPAAASQPGDGGAEVAEERVEVVT